MSARPEKKLRLLSPLSMEQIREMAEATVKASAPPEPVEPEIGEVMPDGTVYAGTSPNTGKKMYAMPRDENVAMDFNEAAKYAKELDAHGHNDWRVPTKEELNVLFENRNRGALAGTFNLTGSYPSDLYWSSTPYYTYAGWYQRFSGGERDASGREARLSVRCLR